MSLIDINGLIRRRAEGVRSDASRLAGPDPIDLPKRRIDECGIFCTMVRKS
jgi:hypothetical protein